MQLLHLLDSKNPFAFQHNIQLDISYLGKLYSDNRREKMCNALVSILLNAEGIKAISDVYLNTSIKYYLHIDALARLIANRRVDLTDNLPPMFDHVQFQCTAGSDGYLWSPFVPQSSVMVGSQYAGLELMCNLRTRTDGTIKAQVLSAVPNSTALYPMVLCLMTGYRINDTIAPYLSSCLIAQNIIEDDNAKVQTLLLDQPTLHSMILQTLGRQKNGISMDEAKFEFMQKELQQLHHMLNEDSYSHKAFTQQTLTLIKTYCQDISMSQMEQALAELSKELIHRCQDTRQVFSFMKKVFSAYSYAYRDNGLVNIWLSQIAEYLGSYAAAQFSAEIQKNSKFLKNQ